MKKQYKKCDLLITINSSGVCSYFTDKEEIEKQIKEITGGVHLSSKETKRCLMKLQLEIERHKLARTKELKTSL